MNTSYVPLEHPYRIIEYNGTLGIQIGTLIVTKEVKGDGYAIETHSHPVVSYINNAKKNYLVNEAPVISLNTEDCEGIVWNKVEITQVNTVMREDEILSWEAFMDLCRSFRLRDIKSHSTLVILRIYNAWSKLVTWGMSIQVPEAGRNRTITLNVEIYDHVSGAYAFCLGRGDLGIATISARLEDMVDSICRQVVFYESFLRYYKNFKKIRVVFKTQEKRYKELVKILNKTDFDEFEKRMRFHQDNHYPIDDDIEMPKAAEDYPEPEED